MTRGLDVWLFVWIGVLESWLSETTVYAATKADT
jgi:hypothetical protein